MLTPVRNPGIPTVQYKDFSVQIQNAEFSNERFVKVQMELTYACNLHCVHCYTDPFNRPNLLKKEVSTETVFEALERLRQEGFLWLCFTGGEIFMRKDFLQIYDAAYEKGFLITLFTNATLISDAVADHLKKLPPFSIEVSLYGATAETYDHVTQVKGSFERCILGIRRLVERGLPVKIKTSLLTLNRHELAEMENFAKSLNVSFKWSGVVFPRLDGDTTGLAYRIPAVELADLELQNAEVDSCSISPSLSLENPESIPAPPNLYRCSCGKLSAHMNPYGQVGTCTWSKKGRFDFRTQTFQAGMSVLARQMHGEEYTEGSACKTCQVFQHCDKIPEMAVHENKDAHAPVPYFCDLAFGRADREKPTNPGRLFKMIGERYEST